MKRSVAILITLLTLIFPVFARAERIPFTPEAESFYTNALEYWNDGSPLCETVEKSMETGVLIDDYEGGKEVWGMATEPQGRTSKCEMVVKYGIESWQLCRVIMHETGHNDGHGHSGDPTNIMYPQINRYMIAPGCPEPSPLANGATAPFPPTLENEPSIIEENITTYANMVKHLRAHCNSLRHTKSKNQKRMCWLNLRQLRREYGEVLAEA